MIPPAVVLDPSLMITSVTKMDQNHAVATSFMRQLGEAAVNAALPVIALPELASGLGRGQRSQPAARKLLLRFRSLPHLQLVVIDEALAALSAELALQQGLKGCDAVYVALARSLEIPLITLDREQQDRAPADVEVFTPDQALAKWWPS